MKIAITTGDPDGIGFEVTAKALNQLRSRSRDQFTIFATDYQSARWQKMVQKSCPGAQILLRTDTPADWVREAAQSTLQKKFDALVTGPMSKKPTGHTEILQNVAQVPHVFMGFLGRKFHVVLATGHIAVKNVSQFLTEDILGAALESANELRMRLCPSKPLAVLALNPHAGERGLLGDEEILISNVINRYRKLKWPVMGPLVPDAAFTPSQRRLAGVYVAAYHDQGLIPFKALHAHSEGAQMTLGLPFIRTSVDHGTAKDIFGMNKADPGSMVAAIRWARRWR